MIPITLTLNNSERGTRKTFNMAMVSDQLFTPLLAYVSILNTLQSYERQNGVGHLRAARQRQHQEARRARVRGSVHRRSALRRRRRVGRRPDQFPAAQRVRGRRVRGLNLEIDASEQPRSATLERVWVDGTRVKAGTTVDLKVLLRTYRGEEITKSCRFRFRQRPRQRVDHGGRRRRLSQWEARELQVQPTQTRGVPQMIGVLNNARKNNRLYVRMVTRDGGAVVSGESLAALPPSVLAVLESDRNGGSFRPLQSALMGEWEIATGHAVTGSRTLTLPLEE